MSLRNLRAKGTEESITLPKDSPVTVTIAVSASVNGVDPELDPDGPRVRLEFHEPRSTSSTFRVDFVPRGIVDHEMNLDGEAQGEIEQQITVVRRGEEQVNLQISVSGRRIGPGKKPLGELISDVAMWDVE